jgi:thiol-disulfide isomerase/thioredoxin
MLPSLFLAFALADQVRDLVAGNNLAAAEHAVQAARSQAGSTPEFAAALSWLARGELGARKLDRADAYAVETRKLSDQLLRTHKLSTDPWLATAVGAAIEVHALVLADRGDTGGAVTFLDEQLGLFRGTALHERIQKNLNLLSLEGKPAPALDETDWLGPKPPPLAALRGHPVLLFFWAHWCSDCKAEAPILAEIRKIYGPKGLVVIAPTRYYGYVGNGQDAAPSVERKYIEAVRRQYYLALSDVPAPLSNVNFQKYGASTTPTLVLLDAGGLVRLYHPGAISGPELAARIQSVLSR